MLHSINLSASLSWLYYHGTPDTAGGDCSFGLWVRQSNYKLFNAILCCSALEDALLCFVAFSALVLCFAMLCCGTMTLI